LEAALNHTALHLSPDVQEARTRHAAATSLLRSYPVARAWRRTETGHALSRALAVIPSLCDEIDSLNALLAATRRREQNLIAAARATLTADADGEPDPLYYLRDELAALGQLPRAANQTHDENDGRQP
jgi:hypothetical protein